MWGRKEDGAPAPATGYAPAEPPRAAAAPAPAPPSSSTTPALAPSAAKPVERKAGQALIGKSLRVKGAISGHEDLYVDGEIEGTIELEENSLTVGPNGNVSADVKARDITVLGRLTGNVRAGERIEIRKTGSLEGDLTTSRIVIEDGAIFRGSIDIVKPDAGGAKPAMKPLETVAAAANGKGDAGKSGK